jgi:starch-binding outer membrane protein, SusD/RagB family
MKRYTTITLAVAALIAAGCRDNPVANPIDAPTVDELSGPLTPPTLQFLVTGVLAQDRASTNAFPYAIETGILGRDVYRIDASEPRFVSETLGGNPDPGSFAGGGGFAGYYTAIRAANTLILSLAKAPATSFSAAQVSVSLGFLRTMKAIDYWRVIELRDTVGIPIQTDDINAVTPIRCKTAVLAYIASLLDSANADFAAAGTGTTVPFTLPSGFRSFGRNYSSVDNLILFNRAWKGKVDYYRAMDHQSPQPALFPTAVAEITQALGGAAPGAVQPSTFTTGAYYVFVPGGSENAPNGISDSKIGLNPLVKDSVQVGDARSSKIVARTRTSGFGIATSITYVGAVASSANQAAPLAILRDEELVLLRAQAEIESGDLVSAILDINDVRTHYGLVALALPPDKTTAINELLYEKRYSLLFEGPMRWDDLRAYGRLNATFLRLELATDPFNASLPIPRAELNARGVTTNPACTP